MATERLSLERLQELLDAYGAEPARWPVAEREAALTLLDASAEARRLSAAAARLDAALDEVSALRPSAALTGRILEARPRAQGSWRAIVFGAMPLWRPAAAFALALVLGLGLGWTRAWPPAAEAPVEIDVAAIAFPSNGEEEVN
ncbi:MAG: hypothetical protein QF893_06525 [Alphaproteobacteria bacterium]|jgi:hypothetical protein|nr:hypothetical protein [Alphaproteobacteria bacterium]